MDNGIEIVEQGSGDLWVVDDGLPEIVIEDEGGSGGIFLLADVSLG